MICQPQARRKSKLRAELSHGWQRRLIHDAILTVAHRITGEEYLCLSDNTIAPSGRPADPRLKPSRRMQKLHAASPAGPTRHMEQRMDQCSPQALLDLYSLQSNSDKEKFLQLLGSSSTAEAPFWICKTMSILERGRFCDMVFEQLMAQVFPLMQMHARNLAREGGNLSNEEFDSELHERVRLEMENYNQQIGELHAARLKDKRDRKSDPETIQRNVQVCNLRKQDSKKWSLGRLAKQFDITKQSIQSILKEEAKWRRLASRQSTD
jgi:hypothetical protein